MTRKEAEAEGWIPVETRLPKPEVEVATLRFSLPKVDDPTHVEHVVFYEDVMWHTGGQWRTGISTRPLLLPTHWRALP